MSQAHADLPAVVANVARGWNRRPTGIAMGNTKPGRHRPSVSAALWTHALNTVQEVSAEPNAAVHSIAIAGARFHKETSIDGRVVFDSMLSSGACNIIRAGERPRGVLRGPWRMLHVYLPSAILTDLLTQGDLGPARRSVELISPGWSHDTPIERIGREILDEIVSPETMSSLLIDALVQALAVHLLRSHSNLAGPLAQLTPLRDGVRGGLAPWQLRRAQEAMEADLGGDIGLGALAALVGVSPTHFSRAFKRSTGSPPFAWLLQRRIDRAIELLATTSLTLADIALSVGFSAQPQFTTAFRRVTGMTPGAWRRQHRV